MLADYIKLMRPKHYLKNVLIFLPLVFSGNLFKAHYLAPSIFSFLAFSMVASSAYIINDIKDKGMDALHSRKKHRPIAAGTISTSAASTFVIVLLGLAGVFQALANFKLVAIGLLAFYLIINIAYSFGLKNVPIIDVFILALGFVIRVFYGGSSANIDVSKWLYLAILAFSFYLGLGKRRNELKTHGATTRKVNQYYNQDFLDKNMYVCLGLTITYYSLWAIENPVRHLLMFWTIPLVIAIVMTYSLAIEESGSDGDPVTVILGNKSLLALLASYGILVTLLIYA